MNHQVIIGDEVVWEGEFEDGSTKNFPPEYLARPESGSVTLKIDGEIVGVQRPEADEISDVVEVSSDDIADAGEVLN